MTIHRERMLAWVEALESGEFKQGHNYLRTKWSAPGREYFVYCCLGVLTELAVRDGVELELGEGEFPSCGIDEGDHEHTLWCIGPLRDELLYPEVQEWVGHYGDTFVLRLHDESHRPEEKFRAEALNDDAGESFREIARRIRIVFDLNSPQEA